REARGRKALRAIAENDLARRHVHAEAHGGGRLALALHVEGDVADLFRRDVDAVDLAARPQHDRLVVRRPRNPRVDAVDGPGLLHVALEAVPERPLDPRLEVFHEERRLVADAADEGEGLSVGRGRRADRAAGPGHEVVDAAGLAVEAPDDVDLPVRIRV